MNFIKTTILNSVAFPNQFMWRGLSGSDDLAWAGILCVHAYQLTGDENFINCNKTINGARGALRLFEEIEKTYIDAE